MLVSLSHGLALMAIPSLSMAAAICALPAEIPAPKDNDEMRTTRPRLLIGIPLFLANAVLCGCLSLGPYPQNPAANLVYILAGFAAMLTTLIALISLAGGLSLRRRARKAKKRQRPPDGAIPLPPPTPTP